MHHWSRAGYPHGEHPRPAARAIRFKMRAGCGSAASRRRKLLSLWPVDWVRHAASVSRVSASGSVGHHLIGKRDVERRDELYLPVLPYRHWHVCFPVPPNSIPDASRAARAILSPSRWSASYPASTITSFGSTGWHQPLVRRSSQRANRTDATCIIQPPDASAAPAGPWDHRGVG